VQAEKKVIELEEALREYHGKAAALQLIPRTAKRANGMQYEIVLNAGAVAAGDMLTVDMKGTIKPVRVTAGGGAPATEGTCRCLIIKSLIASMWRTQAPSVLECRLVFTAHVKARVGALRVVVGGLLGQGLVALKEEYAGRSRALAEEALAVRDLCGASHEAVAERVAARDTAEAAMSLAEETYRRDRERMDRVLNKATEEADQLEADVLCMKGALKEHLADKNTELNELQARAGDTRAGCARHHAAFAWGATKARRVTLSARWATPRARWVTLRARWVTLRPLLVGGRRADGWAGSIRVAAVGAELSSRARAGMRCGTGT
jgi:hypothetical protein